MPLFFCIAQNCLRCNLSGKTAQKENTQNLKRSQNLLKFVKSSRTNLNSQHTKPYSTPQRNTNALAAAEYAPLRSSRLTEGTIMQKKSGVVCTTPLSELVIREVL